MTKTFKELQEADVVVAGLYQKNPDLKNSKFGYAWKRFTDKNYLPLVREFNEDLAGIRVDHALEDPNTKEILIDRMNVRGFKYSKEGLKAVMKAEKALEEKHNAKEVEITPHITTAIPEEVEALAEEQKELLTGLVL